MTGTAPLPVQLLRSSRRALLGSSGALAAGAVGASLFAGAAAAAPASAVPPGAAAGANEVAGYRTTRMNIRMIYREDRFLRGGDNIPFLEQGWPAARFTEPNENFNHQHQDVRVEDGVQFGDLPRFVDFRYVARVAKVNAAWMWSASQAPQMPRDVQVDVTNLTNSTTLLWSRGDDRNLAGYEVVWRPTINPFWTHAIRVGDVTTATVDLSKDNVVFGVRAVGSSGLRSPAVFPFPKF